MKILRLFLYSILFTYLPVTGCSTLGLGDSARQDLAISYPPELEAVQDLIVANKIQSARSKADDYLDRSENIHWFGHAYFLKGFLYEMESNLDKAVELYQTAIEHSSGYDSKVEAKALYNLSFVYEKMGKNEMLLVTLLDLMKRREFFDILTGQVEIPARLAAVYAAEGKIREAKIFQREASANLKTLTRNRRFRSNREELSKSLYYLGLVVYPSRSENYDDKITLLTLGQKYLLAAAEASKSSWGDRAKDKIFQQYELLWQKITNHHAEGYTDPDSEKKHRHEQQLVMASDLYDIILLLRAEEFPLGDVNRSSKAIMDKSAKWLTKVEAFAQNLDLGPQKTRNQKIKNKRLTRFIERKREPVPINPETVKPQELKQSSQPKGSETQLPPKKVKSSGIGTDPNL